MRPVKIDGHWFINVYTQEFGGVLLLDTSKKITPFKFKTREEALEAIQSIRNEKSYEVDKIREAWNSHRQIIKKAGRNYGDDNLHPMILDDIRQVEWLIGEIESLNGMINLLIGEVNDLEQENERYEHTLRKISKPDDKQYINDWRRFYEKHGEISFQEYTKHIAAKALEGVK